MTPDLVIFDCDGVIVDSEGPTCAVIAKHLREYGMEIQAEDVHELFVGQTIHEIHRTGRLKNLDLPDDWSAQVYEEMFEVLAEGVPLSAGVVELFDALEAQGTRIAIASNGAIEKMQHTLGPHGLFDRFADGRMFSGHTSGAPKPQPGMLQMAMEQAKAAPARTFMIDDSVAGEGAARNAGTRFYGYNEHGGRELLEPTGAEIVMSMQELHDRLVG